jgi:hypothetical protein
MSSSKRETPEQTCWRNLVRRCEDSRDPSFANYGGRGIRVFPAWRLSFAAFFHDVGKRPSPHHSLDRIDNDGHYWPGNVRWATRKEQANNTRTNRRLSFNGETLTITEWAARLGVPPHTVSTRLARGWSLDRVLTPARPFRIGRQARLTAAEVREARERKANGASSRELAKAYRVGLSTMQQALSGHSWRFVGEEAS